MNVTEQVTILLRNQLHQMSLQGYETAGQEALVAEFAACFEKLFECRKKLANLKQDPLFIQREPMTLAGIRQVAPNYSMEFRGIRRSEAEISRRVRASFLASVVGCQLGKPVEVSPDLERLKKAGMAVQEWPINDYLTEAFMAELGERHLSADTTTREKIQYVTADDDLNYTIIGMRMLEMYGLDFTRKQLADYWLENIPLHWSWGPERKFIADCAAHEHLFMALENEEDILRLTGELNPGNELCGAAIRMDSYGFACPGLPGLAAELAFKDASMTHRYTGVYASMLIAAAVAMAPVSENALDCWRVAMEYIPPESRFGRILRDEMDIVENASDWESAYDKIHERYGEYGHAMLYQECGFLLNSAKFGRTPAEACAIQVMQGCDTDSFGKIAGTIAGGVFAPDALEERWLAPFHNDFRVSLAEYDERSLSATADRIAALPRFTEDRR